MERGLGEGALSGSQEEHSHFVPQMEEFEKWVKSVHDGQKEYDSKVFLEYMDSFADTMVEHMNHVSVKSHLSTFTEFVSL